MSTKKILYIITLAELGGAQANLFDLIEGFHTHYDVHLATSSLGPLTETTQNLGVPVHLLPDLQRAINLIIDSRAVKECIKLIRQLKPDVIHAHSSKAGLVARLAAKATDTPIVFTAHGWGFKPGVPPIRRGVVWTTELLTTPLITKIVCPSLYDKRLAEQYLVGNKNRLVTIPYGLPPTAPSASPTQEPINIIMTARFHEPKEQRVLLRAFAKIQPVTAKLILVGGGDELSLSQDLASELGITDKVEFLGDRTDVPDLLAQSQIFVLLSRYECLPISILEAMRAGLPVIGSNVGGVSEEIEHGVTGFLTPRSDVETVAGALNILIAHPDLRQKMGQAGQQKFLAEFTLNRMLTRMDDLYRSIISRN
ncbi:glycosyltransferase family 4 protein [Anaerolineales bacterium HSG24]|nr:glycosyltransferase family 4 protein [Anaerolineales bacterium HSG24]